MHLAEGMRAGADGGTSSFTCSHYDPVPGGKRCRHYLDGGPCDRPDEFMCIEWLKANGHAAPPSESPPREDVEPAPATPPELPPARAITDEQIASFKALGAEVCIGLVGGGSVWLVPEYTGADREELSVEHAATLAALCAVFPGTGVIAFQRLGEGRRRPGPGGTAR